MPKKKVPITELPDKEAIRKLFPKKVVDHIEKLAQSEDTPKAKPDKSHQ